MVPLKDYVDAKFEAVNQAVEVRTEALEHRLSNVNEWRATLESLQRNYLPRAEFDQLQKLVWVGLGVMLALQFLIGLAVLWLHK
jgi:hypothetical protein